MIRWGKLGKRHTFVADGAHSCKRHNKGGQCQEQDWEASCELGEPALVVVVCCSASGVVVSLVPLAELEHLCSDRTCEGS